MPAGGPCCGPPASYAGEKRGADMKQGYIFIAIATIMFSTFEVALKYIAGEINSVQLTFARFFIGFLFLAPLAWRTLKKRGLSLDRKSVAYFALLAGQKDLLPFLTPSFRRRQNAARKMLTEDAQLFAGLFEANPHSHEAVRQYRQMLNLAAAGDIDLLCRRAQWWWNTK